MSRDTTGYVVSPHLEVESSAGDSVVMVHTRLGSRLELNPSTQRFLELFKEPLTLEELGEMGPLEKAMPVIRKLRRAGFLIEQGHRETISDKLLQRISPGLFGCASARDESTLGAATFLGVPFDFGNTMVPGARFGPSVLRRVSLSRFRPYCIDTKTGKPRGWYDNDLDRPILAGVCLTDAGDLFVAPNESPATSFRKLRACVADILGSGSMPVILGGDHSITYPVLAAFDRPIAVIQIDAHTDRADFYEGEEHHHGNFMSRALTLEQVTDLYQVGMRGTTPVSQRQIQGKVRQVLTPRRLRSLGVAALVSMLPEDCDYYITFDIDSLDPIYAPATSTPVPGGLTFDEVKDLLVGIASGRRCIGFDVVEVNPQHDTNDLTVITAVELLLAFLGAHFARQTQQQG